MQIALCLSASPVLPSTPYKNFSTLKISSPPPKSLASRRSNKLAAVAYQTSTVDYSSSFSVFPAEACETIGGDACLADMYPEVNLKLENTLDKRAASETVDREYLQYTNAKTVFCAEACDALGGEFCGREYQRGVY